MDNYVKGRNIFLSWITNDFVQLNLNSENFTNVDIFNSDNDYCNSGVGKKSLFLVGYKS